MVTDTGLQQIEGLEKKNTNAQVNGLKRVELTL
jgi:hypothetical protein